MQSAIAEYVRVGENERFTRLIITISIRQMYKTEIDSQLGGSQRTLVPQRVLANRLSKQEHIQIGMHQDAPDSDS